MDISCCSALYRDSDTNNWHNLNSNVELCNKIIINLNGFPLISLACLLWISVKKKKSAFSLNRINWSCRYFAEPWVKHETFTKEGGNRSRGLWFQFQDNDLISYRCSWDLCAAPSYKRAVGVASVEDILGSRRGSLFAAAPCFKNNTRGNAVLMFPPLHRVCNACLTTPSPPPPTDAPPPHASYIAYITSSCATAPETTARWPAAKHGYTEVGGPPPPPKRKEKCHQLLKFISDAAAFF